MSRSYPLGALAGIAFALSFPSPAAAYLGEYQTAVTNEPSLISYYTFEQSDGADAHGTNSGTLIGAPFFAPGAGGFGKSLALNGTNWLNLGVVEDFTFNNDATGSAEAWVQAGDLKGNGCIFANRDGQSRWSIHMNADKSAIGMWNGSMYYYSATCSIPNPSTNWHHLVVVFDNGSFTVYWDGVLAGTKMVPLGFTDFTKGTQIGGNSPYFAGSENWVGMLDEVAFYADALTPETVRAHYDAFFAGNPPVITRHPLGGTYLAGAVPILSVKATGPNLAYQWKKGAIALAGMTDSALTFPSLSPGDAGTYLVTVSNTTAVVNSSNATIALAPLPTPLGRYQTTVSNEAGLISYYTFDRLLPEDAFSWNEGTLVGTAGWAPGIGGSPAQGLVLDGGGHVNLGYVYDFEFPTGEGTVEGWIRADWTDTSGATYRCMFADRSGYTPTVWSLHMNPTKTALTFFNGSASEIWTIPGGAGTNWHHVAVVFDTGGTYASYYWDGALLARRSRSLGAGPATVQLGSATPSTSESWIGMLDEVAFYSTALAATNIQAHYNAYYVGDPPVINSQPVGGYYLVGQLGQLSVGASGAQLTYQWYKDGAPIPAATNAIIGPVKLTTDFSGKYYVRVSNPAGATNSVLAIVQVGNNMARYQATVLAESSLISYYTFDGSDAQDSRNVHPGTVANAVTYGGGPGGVTNLSLTLDGTGHIDLGQVADFDFTNGTGTVEGWIWPDWVNPAPYDPCLFADRDADGSAWSVHESRWKTEMGSFSSGYQSLPIGTGGGWHHYAVVFDGGRVSMYLDGAFRGSFNQSINSVLAKTTQIGSSAPLATAEGWMGGLDEIAFYSAALRPETIWSHYLAMVGPPTLGYSRSGSELTLFWPVEAVGYTLEYAESLPAGSWTEVSGVVNNQVTVDASTGKRFFRLRK